MRSKGFLFSCLLLSIDNIVFMEKPVNANSNRAIAVWLYIGVAMLVVQIVLGGITRLTESGLSITEWKPITGTLPPLNTADWQAEFDKYKNTSQFQHIHADFTLSDFKKIFFWEWFHRNWARLMGLVFVVGFFYFLLRRKFKKEMILPMVMLFVLGAIQGAIGWIMVSSGLVPERMFVGHVQLATHFMAALVLLVYTFWFALSLSVSPAAMNINKGLKSGLALIVTLLFFQLIYGAFMAGLHAAVAAPTWPKINGQWIPDYMNTLTPEWSNWINNKIAIQFVHRSLAYLILIVTVIWWIRSLRTKGGATFNRSRHLPLMLVLLQVVLGIFTVVLSPYGDNLVYLGVAHQTVAILFLLSLVFEMYVIRKKPIRFSTFGN